MIFTFICIAAGLVLGGLFIGKAFTPTQNVTSTDTYSTQPKFGCSVVKDNYEYQKCIDDLVSLRNFCQDYVGTNCLGNVICLNTCSDKYGTDLKTCPCEVKRFHYWNQNKLQLQIKKYCAEGCSCPKSDCLYQNKNEASRATTTVFKVTEMHATKLANQTSFQTTSNGNLYYFRVIKSM